MAVDPSKLRFSVTIDRTSQPALQLVAAKLGLPFAAACGLILDTAKDLSEQQLAAFIEKHRSWTNEAWRNRYAHAGGAPPELPPPPPAARPKKTPTRSRPARPKRRRAKT